MNRFLALPAAAQILCIFGALLVTLPYTANAQVKSSVLSSSSSMSSSKSSRTGRVKTTKPPKVDESDLPTTIEGENMTGRPDREVTVENNVEVVRGQTTITSDKAIFRQEENEVEAAGNVRMERFGDVYIADAVEMNLDTGAGVAYNTEYRLAISKAQGKAERVDMQNDEQARIVKATYSTCEGSSPDWYLKAETLDVDTGTNTGVAHKSVVYFQDVPFINVPVMSFPMSSDRKSGFLPPTPDMSSKSGLSLSVPYYFNLAPNYDLTLYPNLIIRRGLQMGAEGRYLGRTYTGHTKMEVLPDDQERGNTRYAYSSVHNHKFAPGWSYAWNLNGASDKNYPDDFGSTLTTSSQRLLARDINLNYGSDFWGGGLRVSNYQVLQDVAAPITRPHARLPQLNLRAGRMDVGGFDWEVTTEMTRFWLPRDELESRTSALLSFYGANGDRYIINPKISYPILAQGYFIRPKLSMHATRYEQLENWSQGTSFTRTVPTFSLDSGLVFERDASLLGSRMTQTLEPRLFYVYTPYRDQSKIPLFDTAETTFGFAQIFSENRFAGNDRIADANHVTAALTSRFVEPSGAERLRLTIGERFYFHDERVGLTDNESAGKDRSDLLIAAGGRLTPKLTFDTSLQYNLQSNRTLSASYSAQWQPQPRRVLNAEYRYIRNTLATDQNDPLGNGLEQVTFSGQWPLGNRWYGVGQVSYSLPQSKTIENLVGLEYNADCWVLRMGAHRYPTSTLETNTRVFLQLQLNGLSRIGVGDPLNAMRKTIPGYQLVNEEFPAGSTITYPQ